MSRGSKVSGKTRILSFLQKTEGYNTLSVRQAQARFRVANVTATIAKLRAEGYSIYTNMRKRGDGSAVAVYRLGTPSASFIAQCQLAGVTPKGPLTVN